MEGILVTGGTGFTGSHLVRELHSRGHGVRVVTRSVDRARKALPPGVDLVEGDIVDERVIAKAIRGIIAREGPFPMSPRTLDLAGGSGSNVQDWPT